MQRIHAPLLGALLFLVALFSPARAQSVKTTPVDKAEAERWREDLRYMAEQMPLRHNNLFHTMPREQFETAVRRLNERIPQLARHQIIVEMARIAATVGDGHTNVAPTRDPKIGFRALPVKLYLFKDGLFVRAAERQHAALVGARVVKIGTAGADEALARAREIIGRDNEMGIKFFAPHLLVMPEVLHALGLVEDTESVILTVEQGGKRREVTLSPAGAADLIPPDTDTTWMPKAGWVDMRDAGGAPAPLWLKDATDKFWFERLKDRRALYVQINQVLDKEKETFAAFTQRLLAFAEANDVERLILDLRLNRGGNGELLRSLEIGLIKSKFDQRGRLFVLMGRGTWSAAQFLLNHLEKYTKAVFVGEPSASRGNHYGDSRRITLPNSQLTVRVSVYYWQDWHPQDTRQWTAPDVTAELSSEDYRTNADPALKAALDYTPCQSLADMLNEALTAGGVELAVKKFREFKADPVNRYADTEDPLLVAGQRLLNEKKPEQALVLFKLNEEENAHSFRAYFATGEALLRLGNKAEAVKNFERALALNPKSYDVAESLRRARQQ
ncbi:MAG TPA: tetratricopeptide repeat protein [Pyrinomonadaceae bacterium]|nr:tetratricopeptide repeat protein [Pyrinomonadaceae bacterium]